MLNYSFRPFIYSCLVLMVVMVILTDQPLFAQTNQPKSAVAALSLGPELNIPQRSVYNFGYGASFKGEVPVASTLSLILSAGYHRFSYKRALIGVVGSLPADNFVALKAGARYFLDPRFYTEGELGTIIDHNKGRNTNLFAYALGTGYIFALTDDKHQSLDVGLRFENWSQNRVQQFAIRAAYRFGF